MITEYIKKHWDSCVRFNAADCGTLIGLPYPYIVPVSTESKVGFNELYYWDTYFTCKGLLLSGRGELAKNCVDNIIYLVNKYGYMPNGNRTFFLNRSQPPFLSMMVMDIFCFYNDKDWLKYAYEVLEQEYKFWMTERCTPIGLNQYGSNTSMLRDVEDEFYRLVCKRLGKQLPEDKKTEIVENFLVDAESGWDFNPRADILQKKYTVHIDLNCNLYLYEKNFAHFSRILQNGEEEKWESAADYRKMLINQYLWNGEMFLDYNYKSSEHSKVFSAASFFALWTGVATKTQANMMLNQLNKIEFAYGISACCQNDAKENYQWDYPAGWPPLQYIVVRGLDRYGYINDAVRVAQKYVSTAENLYKKTGHLWEKYNVVTGSETIEAEYGSKEMMGWTAGVYMFLKNYISASNYDKSIDKEDLAEINEKYI